MRSCILGVLVLIAIPASAFSQTIESWSSTDANWTRLDFLSQPPGPLPLGGASYTVTSGRYTIASNALLPSLPAQVGAVSVFNPSIVSPAFSDGAVRTIARVNDANSEAFIIARGNLAAGNYYNLNIGASRGGTFLSINEFAGFTSGASLGNVQIPAVIPGQDYNVEFSFAGSTLSGKVWAAGQPEPAAPQISLTDTSYSTGAIGLGVSSFFNTAGPISATFGAVAFVPEPGTGSIAALLGLSALARRRRG